MAPVLANRSPSAVIDELHFKCLLSAGRQGKVLYEQQLKHKNPQKLTDVKFSPGPTQQSPPPSSNPLKRSLFFDQFSENALWFHRLSGDHGPSQNGMALSSSSLKKLSLVYILVFIRKSSGKSGRHKRSALVSWSFQF